MAISINGIDFLIPYDLPIDAEKSSQFLLIHLLTGTCNINRGSVFVNHGVDYSILPSIQQTKEAKVVFEDFLVNSSISSNPTNFIRQTIPDNRKFYQDLLNEFSNYFIQSSKSCHTAAFVFLYRIFERLSYSVPLLYCSTSKDYIGTFTDFKALFNADLAGELGLFRKFLNQGKFIDRVKLDIAYEINFISSQNLQSNFYTLTTKHCSNIFKSNQSIYQIEIKFSNIMDFLINLRNRFFHTRTGDGKNNIKPDEIVDPDEYFECVNPIFCSFLSIITLQTITHLYQN